jgi:hypothetical protein
MALSPLAADTRWSVSVESVPGLRDADCLRAEEPAHPDAAEAEYWLRIYMGLLRVTETSLDITLDHMRDLQEPARRYLQRSHVAALTEAAGHFRERCDSWRRILDELSA